ncbi:hypothetical protein [Pontibacter ruber]|uniref:SpoIIAA-like protein n=1 Tax=Pontibacter ruber TaxID=1343895 RepID=A0ABW5CWN8_9BACT|nr:hypothetical protein [Pontibacter ruber]
MQQLETLFSNDITRIAVDRDHNLVVNVWQKHVSHEEMVQTAVKLNQILKETKADKLLLSALNLGTISANTKEWLTNTYYKSLSEMGLQKLARVLPANLFNKLSLESVMTRAEALGTIRFETRNFASNESAMIWLRE